MAGVVRHQPVARDHVVGGIEAGPGVMPEAGGEESEGDQANDQDEQFHGYVPFLDLDS
jgi:hypothetical protein